MNSPPSGATVLHCGHLDATAWQAWQQCDPNLGWMYFDNLGRLRKAYWLACCGECVPMTVQLAGYGEWDTEQQRPVGVTAFKYPEWYQRKERAV